tara:strand:+ start:657 stop:899 length:243 start_codon:yes stop_codon:yes gene_type:complete
MFMNKGNKREEAKRIPRDWMKVFKKLNSNRKLKPIKLIDEKNNRNSKSKTNMGRTPNRNDTVNDKNKDAWKNIRQLKNKH